MIRPPVKHHGGKGRLYKWIVPQLPEHKIYCEPFGGAASVLLNKPRSDVECYNDLDPKMSNMFRVLRDYYDHFYSTVIKIPYEKQIYLEYKNRYRHEYDRLSDFDKAIHTYVAKRMSRGGLVGTFSWSKRIYSTGPAEVHCWNSANENLKLVAERLEGVEIRNTSAFQVIGEMDSRDTLHYFDPPYLHETRNTYSTKLYNEFEFSLEQHTQLADLCQSLSGKVVLSGYPSEVYEKLYPNWRVVSREVGNHSSHERAKEKKKECLWMNF